MTGPRVQKTVGFKLPVVKNPLLRKMLSIKELRAKKRIYVSRVKNLADNGRKAVKKNINKEKANEMLSEIKKPKFRLIFEEMLLEIEKNPNLAMTDISVNVIRRLKTRAPNEYYANGAINRLYQEGVKKGVIKTN